MINRHIKNIFADYELNTKSVSSKFAHTANDGKVYNVDYYNLDAIYKAKSKRGIMFRK